MKLTIEDHDLAAQVRDYLRANGTEISDNMPVAITLPGAAGKQPQLCMSGSGKMTMGGKFFPGYDAKLKSALHAIVRGKPEKIPVELQESGPMYVPVDEWTPEKALAALDEFGWPHPVIHPPKPKKVKEESTDSDGETGQTKASRRRMTAKAKAEQEAREAEADEARALEDDEASFDEEEDEDLEDAEV